MCVVSAGERARVMNASKACPEMARKEKTRRYCSLPRRDEFVGCDKTRVDACAWLTPWAWPEVTFVPKSAATRSATTVLTRG